LLFLVHAVHRCDPQPEISISDFALAISLALALALALSGPFARICVLLMCQQDTPHIVQRH
jgi:hypothetical protein